MPRNQIVNNYHFDYVTKFGKDGKARYNISESYAAKLLSKRRLIVAKYWKIMGDTNSSLVKNLLSLHQKRLDTPANDTFLLKNQDPLCDLCSNHHFVYGCRFDVNDEPHAIEICKTCLTWYRAISIPDIYEVGINRHVVNELKRSRRQIIEHISLLHSFV